METVNNFITDLLDEMIAKDGTRLLLKAGSYPLMTVDGELSEVTGSQKITQEELVYDLESLEITGVSGRYLSGRYVFGYMPENSNERVRFEAYYGTYAGKLSFDIRFERAPW